MNALPRPTSLDDFLRWEDRQELRHEYDGLTVRAMTGGTWAHSTIQSNLIRALGNALRGKPCRAHGSELKIRTATSIRYPDAMIVCARAAPKATVAPEPTVIFEILSPSSARLDLGAKNAEYQSLTALRRFVVLHQTQAAAAVFVRGEDGEWVYDFLNADSVLDLPEAGIALPLATLYEDVEFSA